MEQERLLAIRESQWHGRSGTLEQTGFVPSALSSSTSNLFANATLTQSIEAPPSLRLKKKNGDTLPPLSHSVWFTV